jgi:eukaryotic-like serine/threonine-protein kinase
VAQNSNDGTDGTNSNGRASLTIIGAGRYAVRNTVGAGGMGEVFIALDVKKREDVAIKNLGKLDAEGVHGFKNEFRDYQHLHHSHLVGMDELFEDSGSWYFSMEYIKGDDLLTHVRRSKTQRVVNAPPTIASVLGSIVMLDAASPEEGQFAPKTPGTHSTTQKLASRSYPGIVDELATKEVLQQLVAGLSHLHSQGKVHRDIKSSNIMVAPDGRVVLIDFGIAMNMRGRPVHLAGTPLYMSPEAFRRAATPMSDWYALGVVLYQALTGRDPYEGDLADLVLLKARKPVHPSKINPKAPEDLAELCMGMLEPNPQFRAGRRAVIDYLNAFADRKSGVRSLLPSADVQEVVIGRDQERDQMQLFFNAYEAANRPVLVQVEGESGVGKSLFVSDFLREIEKTKDAVILSAKVIEEELVPYKAVDGVIDGLGEFFLTRKYEDAGQYFTDGFEVVCDTFPVLRRCARLAELPKAQIPDPVERRRHLFASLKDCLRRIGERHVLIVTVDDIQWTDPDSVHLWNEILTGSNAPHVLYIGSLRTSSGSSLRPSKQHMSPLIAALKELPPFPKATFTMPLNRFSREQTVKFIRQRLLMGASTRNIGQFEEIVRESNGHPLFIDELLQYQGEITGEQKITLESAYAARIALLTDNDRAFLEIACSSAKPIPTWITGRAAKLSYGDYLRATKSLRQGRFIKTGRKVGHDADDWVEPFHSRVQHACMNGLSPAEREARHRSIAETLEVFERTDYELLGLEWRDGGNPHRAAGYFVKAGENCTNTGAFKKSAEMYGEALACRDWSKPEELEIREKRARALRNSGKGKLAAEILLELVEEPTLAPEKVFGFRCEAAELLLTCGYLDEGLRVLHILLDIVKFELPTNSATTLAQLIIGRTSLDVRKGAWVLNDAPSLADTQRVDVLYAASIGLASIHQLQGYACATEFVTEALALGERTRVTKALAGEMCAFASMGKTSSSELYRVRARELFDNNPGEQSQTSIVLAGEAISYVMRGEWAHALRTSQEAQSVIARLCPGALGERALADESELWSLAPLGKFVELRKKSEELRQRAAETQNIFAENTAIGGFPAWAFLASNEPEVLLELQRRRTRANSDSVTLQSLFHGYAAASAHLYTGNIALAKSVLTDTDERSQRRAVLVSKIVKLLICELSGRIALAHGDRKTAANMASKLMTSDHLWAQALGALQLEIANESLERSAKGISSHVDALYASGMSAFAMALIGYAKTNYNDAFAESGLIDVARFGRFLIPC